MSHTFNYIDLGLPSGTLWATCNIGANSSTAAGFYFSDLMFYPLSDTSLINVIETLPAPKAKEIPSIRLATLSEVWEQVGTRLLGIPTDEQVKELLTECDWGASLDGFRVRSRRNMNQIFLPHAGYYTAYAIRNLTEIQKLYNNGKISRSSLCNRNDEVERYYHASNFSLYLSRMTSQPLSILGLTGGMRALKLTILNKRSFVSLPGKYWMPIRPVLCR